MSSALLLPKPMSRPAPRKRRPAVVKMRPRIEAAIQGLVDLLDAIDAPDEDLEPALGTPQIEGHALDAEMDLDVEEGDPLDFEEADDSELEPSLGAPERFPRSRLSRRQHVDKTASQLRWAAGNIRDLEAGDDSGIADAGGLAEQVGAGEACWS